MIDNKNDKSPDSIAEQFQYTIEMSQEAVFWLEKNGQFSYVNDQACRSLGYKRQELLNMFLWDIDPNFPKERWTTHWKQLRITKEANIETNHRRKDGSIFPVEVSACQVNFKGKEFHAAFVRDISDRKLIYDALQKRESLYHSLFEYVPDGILVANQESYYLDANPMMCKMLGYSRDELIGLHASDIVSSLEIEHIEPALAQIKKESKHFRVWMFKRKDESTFQAEVSVTVMPDNNLLALVKDITERKVLEERLLQAQKMESIGRLAGGIAHDFNNLLLPIMGYVELAMLNLAPDNKLLTNLKRVHDAAGRAVGLTRQILAFSRKQELEMLPVDLNAVINDFRSMIQRLIGEDIEISTNLEPDLCLVKADKGQVEQILLNLAVNARDAMPAGGILTIETANVEIDEAYIKKTGDNLQPGLYALITVSDTGNGMTTETQNKIFDPFFTTKVKGEGTGLGLSTTFGIVKQHKGSIWVYSELEKGSSFKILLPQTQGEILKKSSISTKPSTSDYGTETILVVEDADSARRFICEALETYGYNVIEAGDVNDAILHLSKENKIDLLITDVIMPIMTGKELYNKAITIKPELKVLYVSGYTDNIITNQGILDENVNFLQKPFSHKILIRKLRKILSQ